MSRNYGLGSRDMGSAGRIALDKAADKKEMSFLRPTRSLIVGVNSSFMPKKMGSEEWSELPQNS